MSACQRPKARAAAVAPRAGRRWREAIAEERRPDGESDWRRHAADCPLARSCCSWSVSACSATPPGPTAIGCRRCRHERDTPAAAPSAARRPPPPPRPSARACWPRCGRTGVLRVGMEPDAPPLHFINDRKQEDGFDFRLAGLIAEGIGAKRVQVVEADYEELPDRLARRRNRHHHGRLRPRSVDRGRGLVQRLPRLRPLPDRAGGHGGTYRSVARPRRQAHRHLRRPGGRALGEAEHSGRAHQQVLRRRRLVRGGGEGPGRCARSTTIRSRPKRSRRTRERPSSSTT